MLNTFIEAVTGRPETFAWLAKPQSALYSVIVAWSWQQMGLSMVIFLAGLTAVPADLTEAAAIEGANRWPEDVVRGPPDAASGHRGGGRPLGPSTR